MTSPQAPKDSAEEANFNAVALSFVLASEQFIKDYCKIIENSTRTTGK